MRVLKSVVGCFYIFLFSFVSNVKATHIVGGELYYERLSPFTTEYRITLVVYRDCYTGVPPFDPIASIGIFNQFNVLLYELCIPVSADSMTIPPTIVSPCFIPPTDVCYRKAYYVANINLPSIQGGYQLAYQRCCRNFSILNIQNPLAKGITIYATIPTNLVNSNPVFDTIPPPNASHPILPPPFLCLGVPFVWDNSAIDADGDSLVYELCQPFEGGLNFNNCPPGFPQCGTMSGIWTCGPQPMPPFDPPYLNVQWQPPFSIANLLGGIPLTINPVTGILTCTPNTIGQFVIGVCVREYRNSVLLSKTRRDFQLNVVPCPSLVIAALQTPIISCGSNSVAFQNNSIGASTYFWNFGDPAQTNDTSHAVTPTYVYPDTGVYTVTLIAYSTFNPGCADTTTGIVHLYPPFAADFTFNQVPCFLTVSFNSTSQNTGSGFANSWQWNFGDNTTSNSQNPSHTYASSGTYTVTLIVYSDSGCVDTIQKTLTVNEQLLATASILQHISCYNDCNAVAMVNPTSGDPPYSFQWTPGTCITDTCTGLCAGNYTVIITDSNGCSVTKSFTIANPPPLALSVSSTDAYCGGRCYGTATALATGGTPPYSYSWSDPQNQTTQFATGLCADSFTVVITDALGCTFADTVAVNFSNYIPPLNATVSNDTIYEGQTVQIISTVYLNGIYSWSPSGGLNSTTISNPTATPPFSSITYVVEFVDSNGCANKDSVTIFIKKVTCTEPELFIPNAFTPNGDNNNDILYVRGSTIRELLFRVYNRWGEKVFETVNPGQGWDATYKGKPVLPGVYDYYFEAICYDNNKFFKKGNVTVIK